MPLKLTTDPMLISSSQGLVRRSGTSQPETKDSEACNCAELFPQKLNYLNTFQRSWRNHKRLSGWNAEVKRQSGVVEMCTAVHSS